jgi:hypothetical protein
MQPFIFNYCELNFIIISYGLLRAFLLRSLISALPWRAYHPTDMQQFFVNSRRWYCLHPRVRCFGQFHLGARRICSQRRVSQPEFLRLFFFCLTGFIRLSFSFQSESELRVQGKTNWSLPQDYWEVDLLGARIRIPGKYIPGAVVSNQSSESEQKDHKISINKIRLSWLLPSW